MKTSFNASAHSSVFAKIAAPVALTVSVLIAGCGGGGGAASTDSTVSPNTRSSDGGGPVSSSVLKGVVLDGYLVGAKVCLDLNANWVCDAGEPTATSTAGGQYSLDVSPLKYTDTYTKTVIAEVEPDVFDEAEGKTLKAQGLDGYVLGSWGGPKPILSAINTLVLAKYASDGIKDVIESYSIGHLLEDSSMSSTGDDYFDSTVKLSAEERELAKRTGRVLSAALSAAQTRLKATLPSLYGADSAGLGLRSVTLLTQALRETRPANASESEAAQLARTNAQINTTPLVLEQERAKRGNGSTVSAAQAVTVLSGGLIDVGSVGSLPHSYLQYKASGNTGAFTTVPAVWRSGAWTLDTSYQSNGAAGYRVPFSKLVPPISTASGTVSIAAPTVQVKDSVLSETFSSDANVPARELRLIQRDVGGLPYAALPGLEGLSGTFGSGQKVYQLRRKSLQNEYVFDRIATFFSSLDAFMSSARTCYGGICWSITKMATGNFPETAGTMAFSTPSSGGSLDLGEAKFVEDGINGVRILRMISIPITVQNRSADWSLKEGRYPLFADFDGKLWAGRYTPATTYWYSSFLLPADALAPVLVGANLGVPLP